MGTESSGMESVPFDIDNRTIAEVINTLFRKGDRIEVFEGATQINATGSFIRGGSDFFLWKDGNGNLRFQYLGGAIGIRKLQSDRDPIPDSSISDYRFLRGDYPSPDYNESWDR